MTDATVSKTPTFMQRQLRRAKLIGILVLVLAIIGGIAWLADLIANQGQASARFFAEWATFQAAAPGMVTELVTDFGAITSFVIGLLIIWAIRARVKNALIRENLYFVGMIVLSGASYLLAFVPDALYFAGIATLIVLQAIDALKAGEAAVQAQKTTRLHFDWLTTVTVVAVMSGFAMLAVIVALLPLLGVPLDGETSLIPWIVAINGPAIWPPLLGAMAYVGAAGLQVYETATAASNATVAANKSLMSGSGLGRTRDEGGEFNTFD